MVVVYKFLIFVLMKKVHCPLFVNTWLKCEGYLAHILSEANTPEFIHGAFPLI